ncbi:uncharacterized protein LOC118648907 [Monomorium pharaonis]|uniref:uncharacterized protein LOC118648907 n=1 Tax=Monomorium pharaonis TaxID=307658 RepID=UPI00174661EC|nr:uncharacterized protein LOC118648907 [Monomorium pharaonis]
MPVRLNVCQKLLGGFIYIFPVIFSIFVLLSHRKPHHALSRKSKTRVQGVRKHPPSGTSRDAAEGGAPPQPEVVPENRGDRYVTKNVKQPAAAPRVAARHDASLRNIDESGSARRREVHENNGTFFRKLSATPIHPTDLDSLGENRSGSEISQNKRFSSEVYEEPRPSGVIDRELEKPIGTDVIVSNTDVSDNSVTVSVICPERTPELFSKNQPKRKREGDAPLDRFSLQSGVSAVAGERI